MNLSDDKYEPKFNKALMADRNGNEYSSKNSKYNTRAFKFEPTLLFRRTLGFSFEKLFDILSLEAGGGIIYGMDPILKFGLNANGEFSTLGNRVGLLTIINSETSFDPGLYFSGTIKGCWFSPGYFDGYYTAFSFRYAKFGLSADARAIENETGGKFPVGYSGNIGTEVSNAGYYIIHGFHYSTLGKIQTVHDFYFGTGFRFTKYSNININEQYNSSTYTFNKTLVPTSDTHTIFFLSIVFGYSFGFGF